MDIKIRMVGSCFNSCRKLIDYLTTSSRSSRLYQNFVFSLICCRKSDKPYDFLNISRQIPYKIDGINEFYSSAPVVLKEYDEEIRNRTYLCKSGSRPV